MPRGRLTSGRQVHLRQARLKPTGFKPAGPRPAAEPPTQLAGRMFDLGIGREPPHQLLDQLIAVHVGLAVPFFVLLFGQIYESERVRSLLKLAITLGAGRFQRLYRIAVPILLKRAFTNILLLFVAVLGSYEIPLLLDRQSPQMLSVLTMRKYGKYDLAEKPEAFIIALLYSALVGVVIALAFRYGHDAYDV